MSERPIPRDRIEARARRVMSDGVCEPAAVVAYVAELYYRDDEGRRCVVATCGHDHVDREAAIQCAAREMSERGWRHPLHTSRRDGLPGQVRAIVEHPLQED